MIQQWASIRPHNTPSRRIAAYLGMRIDRIEHDERGHLLSTSPTSDS
jgi:ribosomal-protein-alanine N-acetyltransferase